VTFVKQAVELCTAPAQGDDEVSVQSASDRPQGLDLHGVQFATLRARDHILTHTRTLAHIFLALSEPMADRSQHSAEFPVIHSGIVTIGAYRSLICVRWPGDAA
jgi:hypothetical protein